MNSGGGSITPGGRLTIALTSSCSATIPALSEQAASVSIRPKPPTLRSNCPRCFSVLITASLFARVVTIRSGRDHHVEIGAVFTFRNDLEVMQGDDPRKARDTTHELAEIVITAHHVDDDRKLYVE